VTDVLSAALDYAAKGWHLFPVRGKVPAIPRGTSWQDLSTTDPEVLVSWFAGTSGLGVAVDLGKSSLAVVDGDHLDRLPVEVVAILDSTGPWLMRGRPERRSHVYGVNGHPVPQARHPWGEVKAAGGYVVLPPSPHPDGFTYEWLGQPGDAPPVLPFDLAPLIAPAQREAPSAEPFEGAASEEGRAEARRRLALQCQRVAEATSDRNITLNAAALVVGHYVPHYVPESDAVAALLDAATRCGLVKDDGKRSVQATIHSGLRAGMKDPQSLEVRVTLLDVDDAEVRSVNPYLLPDAFWDTDELRTIRQAAHAAQLGAAGLLGAVLARVSALTHHSIELPRTRNRGTLNIFVGLVVGSGGGKGSSVQVASRLLPSKEVACFCGEHPQGDYVTIPPGSGEGLTRAFWEQVREGRRREWARDRAHVLLDVDEIETLLAITGRSGATIGPVLRSLWSGAQAGFQNASADRRFPLAEGSYRVAMVAGVQPSVVAALFDEAMGGTPQRMLWVPAHALDVPNLEAGEVLPDEPAPLPTVQMEAMGKPWMAYGITVDPEVRREMDLRRNRIARGVEKVDTLDAHRDFMRLRVAALLARLHQETEVTPRWWAKAEEVMRLSDATRSAMLKATREQDAKRVRSAGVRDHIRRVAMVEQDSARVEKAAKMMANLVAKHHEAKRHEVEEKPEETCAKRCAMNAPGGRFSRAERDEALTMALDLGWLDETPEGRLALGKSRPA
jgi:hypothetical protein